MCHKMDMKKSVTLCVSPKVGLNAAALFNTIKVERGVLDCGDVNICTGILAHELSHIKAYHYVKKAISILILVSLLSAPELVAQACSLNIHVVLWLPYVFGSCILWYGMVMLVSWYFEYEADAIAAHYVGVNIVGTALKAADISRQRKKQKKDFLHPPISKRIANLSETRPRVETLVKMIKATHPYLLWAVYIAAGGWLCSLIVIVAVIVVDAGLLGGFMLPLVVSPTLWLILRGLLILSCTCAIASIVLLVKELWRFGAKR